MQNDQPDLKKPEWQVFTRYNPQLDSDDFRLRSVNPPVTYAAFIDQGVLPEQVETHLARLVEQGDFELV